MAYEPMEDEIESAQHARWIYCPRGCNALFTAGEDECGTCGALMSEDALEDYEAGLIAVGQLM